jgi:hypothetical protein
MPKVTLSADRVQELSRSLEQALEQLRNDTSADSSGWSELYSDDKMKAYQIDVPNCYIRKVKGEAIVNTSMTTHEFFDFIDGMKQIFILTCRKIKFRSMWNDSSNVYQR